MSTVYIKSNVRGIGTERIDTWAVWTHFSGFPLENTQNHSKHPRAMTRVISEPGQRERGLERVGGRMEPGVRVVLASRARHVMERKHKKTSSVSEARLCPLLLPSKLVGLFLKISDAAQEQGEEGKKGR